MKGVPVKDKTYKVESWDEWVDICAVFGDNPYEVKKTGTKSYDNVWWEFIGEKPNGHNESK